MATERSNTGATAHIADYVVAASYADLPERVRHEARRAFVNILGCAVGGARHNTVETAARALLEFSGPAQATLIGRGEKADILTAALVNTLSTSVYAFNDTHSEAVIHPGGMVAMALLALAERKPVAGPEFLLALTLGIEIASRLSKAISVAPAVGDVAWKQGGVAGGAGVAAAAGKLLGLDARRMAWAIGGAVNNAGGLRVHFGTMNSSMANGQAAHTGLRAAIMADRGLTAAEDSIEGRHGFAATFAEKANLSALTDGLRDSFELLGGTYKPFPCGIVIHAVIDGCLQLKAAHRFSADEIERIQLRVPPLTLELCSRPAPKDDLQAKVSVQHWAAAAVARGRASLSEGSLEAVLNPAITALRARVAAEADSAYASDEADVTLLLKNGRRLHVHVDHCVGSLHRPMSDRDLDDKFRGQADGAIDRSRVDRLLERCWALDSAADVGDIARAVA